MSIPFSKIKTYLDYEDSMPIGKYLGKTIRYVLENDPAYLRWCVRNVEEFYVSNEIKEYLANTPSYRDPPRKSYSPKGYYVPYNYDHDYDPQGEGIWY